eukprot:scaffold73886_cov51-Phaeocystis_antarctica.AAC.2
MPTAVRPSPLNPRPSSLRASTAPAHAPPRPFREKKTASPLSRACASAYLGQLRHAGCAARALHHRRHVLFIIGCALRTMATPHPHPHQPTPLAPTNHDRVCTLTQRTPSQAMPAHATRANVLWLTLTLTLWLPLTLTLTSPRHAPNTSRPN